MYIERDSIVRLSKNTVPVQLVIGPRQYRKKYTTFAPYRKLF